MLERLSNGRIPAGVHRVVADDDAATGDRFSVVQFCHPAPWFALAPLPTCVDDAHPLRYGTHRSRRAPRPRPLRHRPHPPRLTRVVAASSASELSPAAEVTFSQVARTMR